VRALIAMRDGPTERLSGLTCEAEVGSFLML